MSNVRRYILTGTPGSGKTTLLRALETMGYPVVEEAATDVIALALARGVEEPWIVPGFVDKIVDLQRQRQTHSANVDAAAQFFDRSPFDNVALCRHLGISPPSGLRNEIARVTRDRVYERRVLFIENIGACAPTDARRISFADALRFEQVHRDVFDEYGFERVAIPAGSIDDRGCQILTACFGDAAHR